MAGPGAIGARRPARPGLRIRLTGRQRRSAAGWILAPSPPPGSALAHPFPPTPSPLAPWRHVWGAVQP